jgi:hypothetical protein
VRLNDPPSVAAVAAPRIAREFRLEPTAVRVPSTRRRVLDAEPLATITGESEASIKALVEVIVPASAAFAWEPETSTCWPSR